MRIAVTDTETTGTEEQDQVVEVAAVSVRQGDVRGQTRPTSYETGRYAGLILPTVPIHVAARATHHITDLELADKGSDLPDAMYELSEYYEPVIPGDETVFAAHNAEFDLRLLRQTCEAAELDPGDVLPERHICTLVCARHLYPDSPGHSNQVLRYYLGLDRLYGSLTVAGMPPHRAPSDALVTSRLLMHMLETHEPETLIILTQTPVLQVWCRMPKHAGKTWAEVASADPSYMRWMLSQGPEVRLPGGNKVGFDADTVHTLKYHLGLL